MGYIELLSSVVPQETTCGGCDSVTTVVRMVVVCGTLVNSVVLRRASGGEGYGVGDDEGSEVCEVGEVVVEVVFVFPLGRGLKFCGSTNPFLGTH